MPLQRLSNIPPRVGAYTPTGAFNNWVTLSTQGNPAAGVQPSAAFETWAAIRALNGQEIQKAQQIAQKSSHLVTIVYQGGVFEGMTVSLYEFGTTRVFQIEDIVDPDERHIELRMTCSEINQNAGSAS
jgi:SPP1 family predicted phage head-tail adaptor